MAELNPRKRTRDEYWSEPVAAVPSQCNSCDHQDRKNGARCTAFPTGIPREIIRGDFDHEKPYPGDHGVRFAARDK